MSGPTAKSSASPSSNGLRRAFDVLFALGLVVLSLPLWLLAAAGIRLTSPGPIFYVARRVGLGGREFGMLKFRTMHLREDAGPLITAPCDVRIFPFGGFLRASKIDELPQLINILRGDMSFVGPRPEDPQIVKAHYEPWMRETLTVLPGLTSPGSLYYMQNFGTLFAGERSEADYINKVMPLKLEKDLDFVRNPTLRSYFALIFRTALAASKKLLSLATQE